MADGEAMKLDPETIKALLAKPERQPSTRTRKTTDYNSERTIDNWFDMNRKLGSDISGECTVEDCVNLEVKGTRHAVTVDVPISPILTVKMCRRCYVSGRRQDG